MPKGPTRSQLARKRIAELAKDVQALNKDIETKGLKKDALIDILIKREEEEDDDPLQEEEETDELEDEIEVEETTRPTRARATRNSTAPAPASSKATRGRKPAAAAASTTAPAPKPRGRPPRVQVEVPAPGASGSKAATTSKGKGKATATRGRASTSGSAAARNNAPVSKARSTRAKAPPPRAESGSGEYYVTGEDAADMDADADADADPEPVIVTKTEPPATQPDATELESTPIRLLHAQAQSESDRFAQLTQIHEDRIFALETICNSQRDTIQELTISLSSLQSKLASVLELGPKLEAKTSELNELMENPVVEELRTLKDAHAELKRKVGGLNGRIERFEVLKLEDTIGVFEHKMKKVEVELKEDRKDLIQVDGVLEMMWTKIQVLEDRPSSGRVVAYASGSGAASGSGVGTKRARDDDAEDAAAAAMPRPPPGTRIMLSSGLSKNSKQWVEEGPNGFTVVTRTSTSSAPMPSLSAAYARDTGFSV